MLRTFEQAEAYEPGLSALTFTEWKDKPADPKDMFRQQPQSLFHQ
jgi:hypothetical protein